MNAAFMQAPERRKFAVIGRGITKSFGDLPVLRDMSVNIPRGVTYCLLGPNGSGKTTLMRTIMGLVKLDSGEIYVLDEPLNGLDPLVRAETIDLFRSWAAEGKHVILSSHVLQEVDVISDQVVLIANGMIVAEGKIRKVRDEIGLTGAKKGCDRGDCGGNRNPAEEVLWLVHCCHLRALRLF